MVLFLEEYVSDTHSAFPWFQILYRVLGAFEYRLNETELTEFRFHYWGFLTLNEQVLVINMCYFNFWLEEDLFDDESRGDVLSRQFYT